MNFIEFNINPKNKRTKDCVIRAIATATNSSWEYIYRELAELGIKKGLMINEKYLNTPISELPVGLTNSGHIYKIVIPKKCAHIANCLSFECEYRVDLRKMEELIISKDYNGLEVFMRENISKGFASNQVPIFL